MLLLSVNGKAAQMNVGLSDQELRVIEAFLVNPTEECYCSVFRAVSPRVFRYFCLHSGQRDLAEDLTQEVMFTVYRESRHLRNHEVFLPWVFRVARNAWLQHLRDQSRQVAVTTLAAADAEPEAEPNPLLAIEFAEWMQCLDSDEREIMQLRYVEGFEYHEIASILGMPVGTVQWRIFHLIRKLAARFRSRAV